MPDYLRNAQDVLIGDNSNLSTVQRDQHNHYNQIIQTSQGTDRKRLIAATEEEEARYAEYHDVCLGDIVIRRDLGTSKEVRGFFDEEKQEWVSIECECKLFTAEVRSKAGKASSSSYTVVSYHGPEKEEAWKEDFDQFTGALVQHRLHGGAGVRPTFKSSGTIIQKLLYYYYTTPQQQLGYCDDNELWMDPSRGVLCHGPPGPECSFPGVSLDSLLNISSNTELLQEDVLIRYMVALKLGRDLDRAFVIRLAEVSDSSHTTDMRVDRPTVISSLTDTTIAVADARMASIWVSESKCLGEGEVLSNGLTRFTLEHCGQHLELDWNWNWFAARHAWMAQSPMVFHAHGIPLEGNLSKYNLIVPDTSKGTLSQSRTKRRRRQKCDPIYLFAHPSRASTFWSFQEDGHLPIPDDLCKHLGLPVKLSLECLQYTFPTQAYKAMQDYQILRGFDPNTADFAWHCEYNYPKFHPVQPYLAAATTSGQFEDLDDSDFVVIEHETTEDRYLEESLLLLLGEVPTDGVEAPVTTPVLAPAPLSSTFWSRFASPFS
ncbi:hypothetical protein V5O48_006016 [Marasmius crinis-equi]|uniref:Uncharacterized protein n=1 Tax=Marasmius crinis-equi TaxID=585013 RepID=A0ABR3FKR3_9AGAR